MTSEKWDEALGGLGKDLGLRPFPFPEIVSADAVS